MSRGDVPASVTPTYRSWKAMRDRCANPKNMKFRHYGGRGIKVCTKWFDSFAAFKADMGERPDDTTLDRFPNNDGDYEPGNCRWATKAQQIANSRPRSANLIPRTPPSILNECFGRLCVTAYADIRNRRAYWHCRCDCGATVTVSGSNLRKGATKSCGCFRKEVAAANLPHASVAAQS